MSVVFKLILILLLFPFLQINAQSIPYTNGQHAWNPDSLGNHRAVIEFKGSGSLAKLTLTWRRRDFHPEEKKVIIQAASTGQTVNNLLITSINREELNVLFEPITGPGIYHVYYLPYIYEGPKTYYPKGNYRKPILNIDNSWMELAQKNRSMSNNCKSLEFQSVDDFNSFYPMEVIATKVETEKLIENSQLRDPAKRLKILVFPEERKFPIKMKYDLPQRWIENGQKDEFKGFAHKGEYYCYQLGIYALEDVKGLQVAFSDLKSKQGKLISKHQQTCLNTTGINYDGTLFSNSPNVSKGAVQALWCGIDVPENASPGEYTGTATVYANGYTKNIKISIEVDQSKAMEGGINHPELQTRLKWLNSTLAQKNTVIAPYTPIEVKGSELFILGRKLTLGKDGLPAAINSYFTPEMTSIGTKAHPLLAKPMHFKLISKNNEELEALKPLGIRWVLKEPGTVEWTSQSKNTAIEMTVQAHLEFDGFLSYKISFKALKDLALKDLQWSMPLQEQSAAMMLGLGQKGGKRPENFQWKWEVATKNQDGAWLGSVNAGIQFSLRDERYSRPLNTNFYLQKPLLLPTSWGNENKGGINIIKQNDAVQVTAYSGDRTMKAGDVLHYDLNLLITPFHALNTDFQWANRFYHSYKPIDTIVQRGATVVNIHHATAINPYINYPFIEFKKMKDYIDSAHQKGLKVKIYNTIRELSNKAYEIHALRSLGTEIFSSGKGKGFSWLQEHLGDDYIAAWFVPEIKDAAIVNSGMSRWHNYYVEGMSWLTKKVGIDGIYLDDVAFDRVTTKRIKRVLTQDGHPGIIDLHSANQYNKNDGFNNSANLYMEHFPYLNRLWFGEYFDYEKNSPEFYLTEVSGIPFGLMGEMLEGGGNPWRGMIYGMTNRMPWNAQSDPSPLWKLWDEFGMQGSEMVGYWSTNCPVQTNNPDVLATVYKKKGGCLVSIASWAAAKAAVQVSIDWKKLGLDPAKARISIPTIKNFQQGSNWNLQVPLEIEKGKGIILLIQE